jgi:ergothioneine biosynthesis protein EgtB
MNQATPPASLVARYRTVRLRSVELCAPLAIEDHVPQPIADVSPPKWHLGHTTWFFETMLLEAFVSGYRTFHPRYGFVFNSYYESQGARVVRADRGGLSRPTVAEVHTYRAHVDAAMAELLATPLAPAVAALVELGLQHEQQHQELLLTDLKYILAVNPLAPSYAGAATAAVEVPAEHAAVIGDDGWATWGGGIVGIGHVGVGFAFDNEGPRHDVLVPPCALRTTLVRNREYLAFIADGGYQRHALWHAEGLEWVRAHQVEAPLYWQRADDEPCGWRHHTLAGLAPLALDAPVTHLSYYEAFAFAQWADARLPTEFEWETVAPQLTWGARWEWTESAYQAYPGFRPAPGAVGEYNGKFMVNQQVLRGASFATPPGHARSTYRNFFHPPLRWQYTGLRLARRSP